MSLYYTHTLIPDQADYVPTPAQVADFISVLIELGAAPLAATFTITAPRAWTKNARRIPAAFGRNPATREPITIAPRYRCTVEDTSRIAVNLDGLDDYDLAMSGEGPPRLPPFQFDAQFNPKGQPYKFAVRCCVRADIVSTSHFESQHEGITVPPFGEPCDMIVSTGFFTNRKTGETIRAPNAGCARFWVEFALGNWLFPEMKDNSLDLLPTPVVDAAHKALSARFNQGCHWG